MATKFEIEDRVIRTNNPMGVHYGVEIGSIGTVRWANASGKDIQVTWDHNSNKMANSAFWRSENFAHLKTQKENKVPDYVTLDEAWQEGNVIEFTAEANRLGDQWSVGCKQVMFSGGIESGVIRSVRHLGYARAEVRFRVTVPSGHLLTVVWDTRAYGAKTSVYKSQLREACRDFEIIEKAPEKTVTLELTLAEARELRIHAAGRQHEAWVKLNHVISELDGK